jgi:hypothetical protein
MSEEKTGYEAGVTRKLEAEFNQEQWTIAGTKAVLERLERAGAPLHATLTIRSGGIGAEGFGTATATWKVPDHD